MSLETDLLNIIVRNQNGSSVWTYTSTHAPSIGERITFLSLDGDVLHSGRVVDIEWSTKKTMASITVLATLLMDKQGVAMASKAAGPDKSSSQ